MYRDVGYAIIRVGRRETVDEVVFAEMGDYVLLGARALEGLLLWVDPKNKKLIYSELHPVYWEKNAVIPSSTRSIGIATPSIGIATPSIGVATRSIAIATPSIDAQHDLFGSQHHLSGSQHDLSEAQHDRCWPPQRYPLCNIVYP